MEYGNSKEIPYHDFVLSIHAISQDEFYRAQNNLKYYHLYNNNNNNTRSSYISHNLCTDIFISALILSKRCS